ncbi:MAG: periplasmic heavy metal sensor [Marinibacterium sp.]
MTDRPEAPKRLRPWLRIVLIGSLALNLLIVGVVAGAAWRIAGSAANRVPPAGLTLFRALPAEDRKALRAAIRADVPHRRTRRADAQALVALLRATPFDRKALASEMDRQSRARSDFQDAMVRAWIAHVSAMEDSDREAYADRLAEMSRRPLGHSRPEGEPARHPDPAAD